MRLLSLAVLALTAAPALAQTAAPLIDPITPNRAPLAATAEMAPGFELFVGDAASQALFNPARLGLATGRRSRGQRGGDAPARNFIYGTVRPSSYLSTGVRGLVDVPFPNGPIFVDPFPQRGAVYTVVNPSAVSVAAAVGNDALRWVVMAEHRASATYTSGDQTGQTSFDNEDQDLLIRRSSDEENDREYHEANGRVVAVGRAGQTGYSVGVFGGYRLTRQDQTFSSFEQQQEVQPRFSSTQQTTRSLGYGSRDESFAVGAEFGVASRGLDLTGAFSFQRRQSRAFTTDGQSRTSESAFEENDGAILNRRDVSDMASQGRTGFEANAFDGALFAAFHLGDGPVRDAVTAEAFGTVGGGDAESTGGSSFLDQRFSGFDGDLMLENETRSAFSGEAADLDAGGYQAGGAVGYVHRRQAGRVYVVAGARLSGVIGQSRDAGLATANIRFPAVLDDASLGFATAGLALPLYAEAPVVGALRLFGTGIFQYRYAALKENYRVRYGVSGGDGTAAVEDTDRQHLFESSGRFALGARFRTKGGLAAQAAFQGDLAAVARWTVSLGYHF